MQVMCLRSYAQLLLITEIAVMQLYIISILYTGAHGHDHVVGRQELLLRVVDLGEDALADQA